MHNIFNVHYIKYYSILATIDAVYIADITIPIKQIIIYWIQNPIRAAFQYGLHVCLYESTLFQYILYAFCFIAPNQCIDFLIVFKQQ